MMKKVLFTFFLILLCIWSKSQNLVPNYSFEDTSLCPYSGGQINFATPWYSPTTSTTDYFNSCGSSGYKTPLNIWGFQYPKSGNAYAEIGVYGTSTFSIRDYIQVQLIDTLVQDKIYCISFYVSHAGLSSFFSSYTAIAITGIGLLLSNNPILTANPYPLPYTPQIISPVGVYLNDTTNWVKISGNYTALGGEKYITIGNFKDDASTDTTVIGNPGFDPQGYYYIDDVSVIDCDSLIGINEYQNSSSLKLFPNPANDKLSIQLEDFENSIIAIYNMLGEIVSTSKMVSKTTDVDVSLLDNGVYIVSVKTEKGILRQKIIKNSP